MARRMRISLVFWLTLGLTASFVFSQDAPTPSSATQPSDQTEEQAQTTQLKSITDRIDTLKKHLDTAKANAVKARDDYKRLADAAMAKLNTDPGYRAATDKADEAKKELDDARNSGSTDLSALIQLHLDAVGQVADLKNAAMKQPAVAEAGQKAEVAAKAVVAIQSEIDQQVELKNSVRPMGYSDAQWALAKVAFEYRSECAPELDQAKRSLAQTDPQSPFLYMNQHRVDALEARLKMIRRGDVVLPDMVSDSFSTLPRHTGQGGLLNLGFHIKEVISDAEMIAYPIVTDEDQDFWISGYPTGGLADDQETEVSGDFCILKTKTYNGHTMPVLERVDISNLKPAVDYLMWQSKHPRPAAPGQ